jgi:hypothetical protein
MAKQGNWSPHTPRGERPGNGKDIYGENLGIVPAVEDVPQWEYIKVRRWCIGEVAVGLMKSTGPEGDVARLFEKKWEEVSLT